MSNRANIAMDPFDPRRINVDGIEFQALAFDIAEGDGYWGALCYRVPHGAFHPDSNNGASHWDQPDEDLPNIRVAVCCAFNEEDVGEMTVAELLAEGARFAKSNLETSGAYNRRTQAERDKAYRGAVDGVIQS